MGGETSKSNCQLFGLSQITFALNSGRVATSSLLFLRSYAALIAVRLHHCVVYHGHPPFLCAFAFVSPARALCGAASRRVGPACATAGAGVLGHARGRD